MRLPLAIIIALALISPLCAQAAAPRPPAWLTLTDPASDNGNSMFLRFAKSPDDGAGANNVVDYTVAYRTETGAWQNVTRIVATAQVNYNYTVTGLTKNTRYAFGVTANTFEKFSTRVVEWGRPKDSVAPAPARSPRVVNPTGDAGTDLRLFFERSMDDSPMGDVVRYNLYKRVAGGAWIAAGRVNATHAAEYDFRYTGLTPGVPYGLGVAACDGPNESEKVVAWFDTLPPGAPRDVKLADLPGDDGTGLKLVFANSPDDGAGANDVVSYRVFRKVGTGTLSLFSTITATDATKYVLAMKNLSRGVRYTVQVCAVDSYQESERITVSKIPVDNTPSKPPTALALADVPADTGTALNVTFNRSADDVTGDREVTRYDVYRGVSSTDTGTKAGEVAATGAASYAFRATGLTPAKKYWFWAVAVAPTGTSARSNRASLAPLDNRPVAAPTGLTAADRPYDTGGVIDLGWSRSPDDGAGRNHVAKYNIYRRLPYSDLVPVLIGTLNATGALTYKWSDTHVPMELVLYEYTVKASTSGGAESAAAGPQKASASNNMRVAFDPPTNLSVLDVPNDTGGKLLLTWYRSPDEDNGGGPPPPPGMSASQVDTQDAYGGIYEFYRRTATGTYTVAPTFTVSSEGTANPMTYINSGLSNGVAYTYKVRYRRWNQISPFTNEKTATPVANRTSSAAQAPAQVAPADTPTDEPAAAALQVSLVNLPASAPLGQDLILGLRVSGSGASSVYVEYSVDGGGVSRSTAISGVDSYGGTVKIRTATLPAGSLIRLRAVVTGGGALAVSDVTAITVR